MLTYTGQRNLFGVLVNNSDSTVLSTADTLINEQIRSILTGRPWWFLEKAFTLTTQASTQFISMPGQVDRIISSPYVTVGSVRYTPRECPSREYWDKLNLVTYTADVPEWWYSYAGQLGLFPTPTTAGNTITLNAKQKVIDLSIADYTTGTITTTSTTGTTTTVTGSGTSWTTGMIGQYIRITRTSAAGGGDGIWYEIAGVSSSTSLTLSNPYGGTALSGASATYTIGQSSIIPEAYQILPIYLALNIYFTSIDPNTEKAALYITKAKDLYLQLERDHSNRSGGRVLDEGIDKTTLVNPNLTIGF